MLKRRNKDSLLPISTAKTLWGLSQDVIRAIEAEPKRVRMASYITRFGRFDEEAEKPACGVAGCLAGWYAILGSGNSVKSLSSHSRSLTYAQRAGHVAAKILGMELNSYEPRTMVPALKGYSDDYGQTDVCCFDGGRATYSLPGWSRALKPTPRPSSDGCATS